MDGIIRIPCVAAILYNADKQVLLQQRDDKPDLTFAGYWTLFGGKVELGETPDIAIKRELIEEIGLEPHLTHWKTYDKQHNADIIIAQHIFTGCINQAVNDITLNEGQALNYFSQHELKILNIAFGFDRLLGEFFQKPKI